MPYVTWVGNRELTEDVLWNNLVSNPYLVTNTTGYTAQNSGSISRVLPGLLRVTNGASASSWASTPVTTESGKLYRVDVDVTLGTAPGTNIYASTTDSSASGALNIKNATASGTVSLYFVASGTTTYILLQNTGATTGQYNDYDNVRCREVIARGHSTTIEHVINGDFSIAGSWTTGTGWTVGSGVASCDGTQTANSSLANPTLPTGMLFGGKNYDTSFAMSSYSAGAAGINIGGTGSQEGTGRASNATHTETITILLGGAPTNFNILADTDFVGTVDSISMTLATGNSWSLDFDIGALPTQVPDRDVRVKTMMNGSQETLFNYSKKKIQFTTVALEYGTWQFMEEFLTNGETQAITFDPYGTSSQPKSPGSYRVDTWSAQRVKGADTTEMRQYTVTLRQS